MIKYVVRFQYLSLECDGVEKCKMEFSTKAEAEKFYKKIKRETAELLKQYGRFGAYNPYTNISLEKEIDYDQQK